MKRRKITPLKEERIEKVSQEKYNFEEDSDDFLASDIDDVSDVTNAWFQKLSDFCERLFWEQF